MTGIDWSAVETEVTQLLGDLVRFKTVNPPGDETACARFLADRLRAEGLAPVVLESAPGRGSVVARAKGDGSKTPLILLSHLDVVAVEPDKWQRDPFGGEVVDGYVWGRGTLDCKGLTAVEFMALALALRQGLPLKRDVVLVATADEETGGKFGAKWLAEKHWDVVGGEWCINEGGGEAHSVAGKTFYSCQTAEKGTARFKLTARGPAGHGSIPRPENCVITLCKAMARVGEASLPLHRTATMDGLLTVLAGFIGHGQNLDSLYALCDDRMVLGALLQDQMMANTLYAMTHNTMTPTMLNAGSRVNVIPSSAEGRVDGRILPGQTKDTFLAEIHAALDGLPVELEWTDEDREPGALESPSQGDLFDAIRDVMAVWAPGEVVVPYLVTGGTDAKSFVPAGARVYGFCPMLEDKEAVPMELAHNHNERVSVKNLVFGTQVLYDIIKRFCVD